MLEINYQGGLGGVTSSCLAHLPTLEQYRLVQVRVHTRRPSKFHHMAYLQMATLVLARHHSHYGYKHTTEISLCHGDLRWVHKIWVRIRLISIQKLLVLVPLTTQRLPTPYKYSPYQILLGFQFQAKAKVRTLL